MTLDPSIVDETVGRQRCESWDRDCQVTKGDPYLAWTISNRALCLDNGIVPPSEIVLARKRYSVFIAARTSRGCVWFPFQFPPDHATVVNMEIVINASGIKGSGPKRSVIGEQYRVTGSLSVAVDECFQTLDVFEERAPRNVGRMIGESEAFRAAVDGQGPSFVFKLDCKRVLSAARDEVDMNAAASNADRLLQAQDDVGVLLANGPGERKLEICLGVKQGAAHCKGVHHGVNV